MTGLRVLGPGEAEIFASWEASERPYPWSAAQFRPASPNVRTLVWGEPGGPIGFAVLQVTGDEAYLANLMVDPRRRRNGLGATLLQKVMIEARSHGARRLVLDVDAANGPALGLYRKAGFVILERRRRSYPRGEDAIVMKRDL